MDLRQLIPGPEQHAKKEKCMKTSTIMWSLLAASMPSGSDICWMLTPKTDGGGDASL